MSTYGKISNMKIQELLEYGKNNLIEKEEALRLSKMLLSYILGVDNSYFITHNQEIEDEKVKLFQKYIQELKKGIPLQYITQNQEFMGYDFFVNKNVLIPQPDTEILVEEIIKICKNREKQYKILDLCTGSGAIGISIAKKILNSNVTMSDVSEKAIEIANKNAKKNKVYNCKTILSNMFEKIEEKFDIIVSNPPYIKTQIIHSLSKEVQNEPIIALDGGIDGLTFYKIIAQESYNYLNSGGILAIEIGYDQKDEVINLLEKTNHYTNIECKKDLAGNNRVIICNVI